MNPDAHHQSNLQQVLQSSVLPHDTDMRDFVAACSHRRSVDLLEGEKWFESQDFLNKASESLALNQNINELIVPCYESAYLSDWIPTISSLSSLTNLKFTSFVGSAVSPDLSVNRLCHIFTSMTSLESVDIERVQDSHISRFIVAAISSPSMALKVRIPSTLASCEHLDLGFSIVSPQCRQAVLLVALHIVTLHESSRSVADQKHPLPTRSISDSSFKPFQHLESLASNFSQVLSFFLDLAMHLESPLQEDDGINMHRVQSFCSFFTSEDPYEGLTLNEVQLLQTTIVEYSQCLSNAFKISSFWDFIQNEFQKLSTIPKQRYFPRAIVQMVAFWCWKREEIPLPESTRNFFTSLLPSGCIDALTVILLMNGITCFGDYSFIDSLATNIHQREIVMKKLEGTLLSCALNFEDLFNIVESALQEHFCKRSDGSGNCDLASQYIPLQGAFGLLFEASDAVSRLRVIDLLFDFRKRNHLPTEGLVDFVVGFIRTVKNYEELNTLIHHVFKLISDESRFFFEEHLLKRDILVFRICLCQHSDQIDEVVLASKMLTFSVQFWVEVLGQPSLCLGIIHVVMEKIKAFNCEQCISSSHLENFIHNTKLDIRELESIIMEHCPDVFRSPKFWKYVFKRYSRDLDYVLRVMIDQNVEVDMLKPKLQAKIISLCTLECIELLKKSSCNIAEKTWQSGFAKMFFKDISREIKSDETIEFLKIKIGVAFKLFVHWNPFTEAQAWRDSFVSLFQGRDKHHVNLIAFARYHLFDSQSNNFFSNFFHFWDLHGFVAPPRDSVTLAFTRNNFESKLDSIMLELAPTTAESRESVEMDFLEAHTKSCLVSLPPSPFLSFSKPQTHSLYSSFFAFFSVLFHLCLMLC
jgi:hypothetical protein